MASTWSRVLAWSAVAMATCAGVACADSYDEEPPEPEPPAPADAGPVEAGARDDGAAPVTDAAPPDAAFSCASVDADFCADFEEAPPPDAASPLFGFASAYVTANASLRRSTDTAASGAASLLATVEPGDAGENLAFLVRDLGLARQLVSGLELDLALFVPAEYPEDSNVLSIGIGDSATAQADYTLVLLVGRGQGPTAPRAGLLEVMKLTDGGRGSALTLLDRIPQAGRWSRLRLEIGLSPPKVTLTVDGNVALNKPLLGVPVRRDVTLAIGLGADEAQAVRATRQVRHDDLVVRVR